MAVYKDMGGLINNADRIIRTLPEQERTAHLRAPRVLAHGQFHALARVFRKALLVQPLTNR